MSLPSLQYAGLARRARWAAGLALVIGLGAAMPVVAGAALGWLGTRLLRRTAATNK